ncbi:MAG: hypothetical protein J5802_14110 [Butyrivibrio sp.]|nr:hypothetical protein [Butyrivibrio sp.]
MNKLIETINLRSILLKKAIKLAEKEKERFPEGRLRVNNSGYTRYYKVLKKGDSTGEYLSIKSKMNTIRKLAQKDYNKQFLKTAKAELKLLDKLQRKYNQAEDEYNKLSAERQNLVTPYILTDDLIAKAWQSKTFNPNPYKPEKKIFDTRRGEKVRSKSEAIIADMLFEMKIPYRYEYPVRMHNGKIKYPDFTLLKVKTGEVLYLEHFGCLNEEGYRKDTLEKMDIYRASGIYPGKNLLLTYETEDNPLDIKGIRKMLEEVLL